MEDRFSFLSNARTKFIFKKKSSFEAFDKEITSLAQALPVMLRTQGLALTMARLSAGENNASTIATFLLDWLTKEMPMKVSIADEKEELKMAEFIERLQIIDRPKYMALQNEAMEFSEKFKLISKALYSVKED